MYILFEKEKKRLNKFHAMDCELDLLVILNTHAGVSAWIQCCRMAISKELFISHSLQSMVKIKWIKNSSSSERHWSLSLAQQKRPHHGQQLFDTILTRCYHEYSCDVTDLDSPPKGHKINEICKRYHFTRCWALTFYVALFFFPHWTFTCAEEITGPYFTSWIWAYCFAKWKQEHLSRLCKFFSWHPSHVRRLLDNVSGVTEWKQADNTSSFQRHVLARA